MARALGELRVIGVETSAAFHRRVMDEDDFRRGTIDIRYVDTHPDLLRGGGDDTQLRTAALVAALLEDERRKTRAVPRIATGPGGRNEWRKEVWRK
jgi:acetyl-CoA carboxylase biotin carboxylase subunit